MQFKSPGPRVQSRSKRSTSQFTRAASSPKGSTSQFKSPGSIIRSNISAPSAQATSLTLSATPAQPHSISKQPTLPAESQVIIEHPTIQISVKVPTQTLIPAEQAVTQSPRVAFRVFAICLASIAVCVNGSNYGPLIPTLHSVLHIDGGQIGLFSTLFFLGIIVSNVPGGILADRLGSRPVMLAGLSLTTAGSLLFPVFPIFIWMLACRALIGLGAGIALVSSSHACAQLGKYEPQGQGLRGGAAQLGAGLGLVSMAFLQGLLGWRNALFVCGILGLVALIVWLWYPKEVRSANRDNRAVENPTLALRSPIIWMLGLANMGTLGLTNAIMAWISVYFLKEYGLPLALAGALASTALFGGIFFQMLGGLLLARLQKPVPLIYIGTVMCFLSVVALALPLHIFPLAIVGLTLFAVGTTLPSAAIFSTASMIGKRSGGGAGTSQALLSVLASLAAVTGTPLIGLILERTGGFTAALGSIGLIFPAIAVTASLFLGFVLKPTKHENLALSAQ